MAILFKPNWCASLCFYQRCWWTSLFESSCCSWFGLPAGVWLHWLTYGTVNIDHHRQWSVCANIARVCFLLRRGLGNITSGSIWDKAVTTRMHRPNREGAGGRQPPPPPGLTIRSGSRWTWKHLLVTDYSCYPVIKFPSTASVTTKYSYIYKHFFFESIIFI